MRTTDVRVHSDGDHGVKGDSDEDPEVKLDSGMDT